MAELWCEAGQHSWERPAQRGRVPRSCPTHRVVTAARHKKSAPVEQDVSAAVDLIVRETPNFTASDRMLLVNIFEFLPRITSEDQRKISYIARTLWGSAAEHFDAGRVNPITEERDLRKTLASILRGYSQRIEK